ncbi:MAG: penicillin acylase family protein [Anaerolineae bacterium]
MLRFIRGLLTVVVVLVIVVAAAAGGGYLFLTRRAFPQADGTARVSSVKTPINVIRDKNGVPHIYASSAHDLFFAQGYVQAQDRLWQMEIGRRGVAGRTSELSPTKSGLEQDKFVRTLGWRRAAQADYDALDDESKAILQAYADGVNAFISTHENNLPIEFTIVGAFGSQGLNYKPEPWTPIDTLQWAKAMAWSLGGNWDGEVFRARVLAQFGETQGQSLLADLIPPYDYAAKPIIVPSGVSWQQLPTNLAGIKQLDQITGLRGRDVGSNNWTISGSRTTTGKPLLANDPHLAIQMPSIWYFNSLHCQPVSAECPYDVIGAVFPAAPGVIIGHNAKIAWGVTNVGPDVQDLFLEKVDGNQYEYKGQKLDLKIVPETWTIKGKVPDGYTPSANEVDEYDAASNTTKITLNVRYTVHGPLISDVDADMAKAGGGQYAVAFEWTAINAPEESIKSFLQIDKAQNWDDFRAALSVFGSPSQNFVYADVDGNIGYQTPGRIPIRAKGDGQLPVPGWTGEYDWKSYIPFDELPRSYNPPQGYIVTANNAVVGPDYKYFISMDWDRGWRARRIVDLIESKEKISAADIATIQGDSYNLSAEQIVPYLANISVDGDARKVLDAINSWDFFEKRESTGAAAYEVFWLSLLRNTFDNTLGELAPDYVDGGDLNRQAMIALLAKPDSTWWGAGGRDAVLKKSLEDAAKMLTAELGSNPSDWKWSKIHTATFKSQALGDAPVSFIFNRGPIEVDGGTATVNNTGTGSNFSKAYSNPPGKLAAIFAERSTPSLRQIIDLGNLNASVFVHTTGQSGLPTASHYDDFIDKWRNIQYVPMYWDVKDIKANAEGTLTLTP